MGHGSSASSPPAPAAASSQLSQMDFLALAKQLHTIYLAGIPQLRPGMRDEARRLVTLLDVLYDAGAVLRCSAQVQPQLLFVPLLAAAQKAGVNPQLGRATKLDPALLRSAAEASLQQEIATVLDLAPSSTGSRMPTPAGDAGRGQDEGGARQGGGSRWGGGGGQQDSLLPQDAVNADVPSALLAEEVLMYHRASSRLAEMTVV